MSTRIRTDCGAGSDRPTRVLTFMFSPSMLPLSPSRLRQLTAVRIPSGPGLGDLTSQFLLRLARDVGTYSPAEAARLSTAALEVLATRLGRELDVRDWGMPEAGRHALPGPRLLVEASPRAAPARPPGPGRT